MLHNGNHLQPGRINPRMVVNWSLSLDRTSEDTQNISMVGDLQSNMCTLRDKVGAFENVRSPRCLVEDNFHCKMSSRAN